MYPTRTVLQLFRVAHVLLQDISQETVSRARSKSFLVAGMWVLEVSRVRCHPAPTTLIPLLMASWLLVIVHESWRGKKTQPNEQ